MTRADGVYLGLTEAYMDSTRVISDEEVTESALGVPPAATAVVAAANVSNPVAKGDTPNERAAVTSFSPLVQDASENEL